MPIATSTTVINYFSIESNLISASLMEIAKPVSSSEPKPFLFNNIKNSVNTELGILPVKTESINLFDSPLVRLSLFFNFSSNSLYNFIFPKSFLITDDPMLLV